MFLPSRCSREGPFSETLLRNPSHNAPSFKNPLQDTSCSLYWNAPSMPFGILLLGVPGVLADGGPVNTVLFSCPSRLSVSFLLVFPCVRLLVCPICPVAHRPVSGHPLSDAGSLKISYTNYDYGFALA